MREFRNEYPGKCDLCNGQVAKQAGVRYKRVTGEWVTRHAEGGCLSNAGTTARAAPRCIGCNVVLTDELAIARLLCADCFDGEAWQRNRERMPR